ncbi:T9SS type A sorting domain-containing protein [Flavobacterium sp.]|uniref:T9SS type A sorting domain-containing protein n=1 Tax=Flavobacterium sp. TaxID=239 RepID=UPI0025D985F2|nr:T9SS type A sorting domain-containing protein [Flavobacterium sp.]
MKKIYSLLLLVISSVSFGQTLYSENMGVPTATTTVASYITGTAPATFQNSSPIVYSGNGDIRVSSASSTYTGASGGGNAYLAATAGKYFQIDGINTTGYTSANLRLSFGYLTALFATVQVVVEYSTNASAATPTWTPITFTNNTSASWTLVSIPGGILPVSSTLSLRFSQPAVLGQIRIDDVKVINFNPACTLVLGTTNTACDAVTSGIDTYTTTIPYTGGGTGTYTITSSAGTVGGDNPNTVAAGNIIITGVSEGININVSITKGVCSYPVSVTAPECKIVNTLPYSESFPYTVGNVLGAEQKWTNFNSGDFVTVAAGSLTYTGVSSTGNSATFSGTGAECSTSFTPTTSGTLYTAFLMNVSDLTNVTDGSSTYIAAVTGTSNSNYKANLFVKKVGTQYQIGFDAASTTTNYNATLRNAGDVVYVVIGYDFSSNSLSLWLNPTNGASPTLGVNPAVAFTTLGGFTLRQDTATTTPTMIIDELRVVTSLSALNLTLGDKQNTIAGLNIYPNPVSNGTLFIETAANGAKTVTVFDVLGKQVMNATTTDNFINVSSLHTGIYIVSITEEGKTASRKLIIN